MNIKEVLINTEQFLKKNNIENPRLDAEVLLAELLDMERIRLYVNFDYPLSETEINQYRKMIKKRAKNIPVAYILKKKEFMSLDFYVDQNVLLPRPETEILVEYLIDTFSQKELEKINIVEVGTGSGAIMVSLGYYLKNARILGVEIDKAAVEVTRKNINRYSLKERLKVTKGNLLNPLIERGIDGVDLLVSNPPYIGNDELKDLPEDVKKEPIKALDGGKEGLDIYKKLIPQGYKVLKNGGIFALEIGYRQADQVTNILKDNGFLNIEVKKDYADKDRFIISYKE
ncbi:MAG: peptide chain release factor N(5)-glutamine methyltransferase [Halanaerobiales bacterium]|nr:peptide chain release factor N(5)-glutamine methyltransferase [Halanaerobiales bacterium]